MRARNFASRKLLASSIPVEAQLFIQTRAISSYSSLRAGRIVGSVIWQSLREQHACHVAICPARMDQSHEWANAWSSKFKRIQRQCNEAGLAVAWISAMWRICVAGVVINRTLMA